MTDAVIVSTARTPIGRAFKGAFNNTKAPTMAGHAIRAAVERAGVEPGEIEDVILGTAMQSGSASPNLARLSALAAGLPVSVPGQTIDRQCSSGMMAIAIAARHIIVDGAKVCVGGGQEQISVVQKDHFGLMTSGQDENVVKMAEHAYMPMLLTAENVIRKYNISRESQDEYALSSQQRTAAAQEAGLFDDEIVPLPTTKLVMNKESGEISEEAVTLMKDEGNRPGTTL